MSTLWGPALDAELAYRQEQVRSAYDRGSSRRGGATRAGRRAEKAAEARRAADRRHETDGHGHGADRRSA
ncbi:hypothetical protein [Antribacter gilvus]|uniref:hypothetical protein n=1 Tax=Antribacter gilvus TaxID=2304675 RepID=UPI000F76BD6F|nr:hypothetical protein [Antribacter gilvus]